MCLGNNFKCKQAHVQGDHHYSQQECPQDSTLCHTSDEGDSEWPHEHYHHFVAEEGEKKE